MADESFFNESKEQSQIKTAIVRKYFNAWAKVIMPSARSKGDKIGFLDLFAGPGRYKDGTKSTPIEILETAISDPKIREMLVTIFNDRDSDNTQTLEREIAALSGIGTLKFKPIVQNQSVGDDIVKQFENMRMVPTLAFIDPWGYKGLSLRLVNAVLKDWGCDCIIFFNYNRISMGLANDIVRDHMDALFGAERAMALRPQIEPLHGDDRELAIVEALAHALREMGGRYVLPFRFRAPQTNRISHHLIFVSKHPLGYGIMKGIMAKESSTADEGVPSFEYNKACERQPLLFSLSQSIQCLGEMHLADFSGKQLTVRSIFDEHNIDRPFVEKNYKDALCALESEGKITAQPAMTARRTGTFGPRVLVAFPPKGK